MREPSADIADAVNRLVDEYRQRCLWFLREDYYPATDEERRSVLESIERHGDAAAYHRAAEIRRWLSQSSSGRSAVSSPISGGSPARATSLAPRPSTN